jgi:UDP-glucose 4-epimerase
MKTYNCKNLIFSSSATVYGNASVAPYNETMPVGVGITNPYGKTKYMQEEILRDLYLSDTTWNIILLRYFNPISQKNNSLRESPNGIPCNIFPYIVKVHNGELKQLQIFGNDYNTPDGTCVRDFIHVVDIALAHVKACSRIIVTSSCIKTYNIGTGIGVSVKQLVDTFEEVNHTKLRYVYGDKREGDLDVSYADASLAKKELGWVAQYGIKDMVIV